MPNLHVTDRQVMLYMTRPRLAAAQAGDLEQVVALEQDPTCLFCSRPRSSWWSI
jgi:hypothetical protein